MGNGAEGDSDFLNRLWSSVRGLASTNPWAAAMAAATVVGGIVFGVLLGYAPLLLGAISFVVAAVALAWLSRGGEGSHSTRKWSFVSILGHFAAVGIVAFGLMQLVPYGRDHSYPQGSGEPQWSSPRTRELMVNACYDCHSNEVEWPWYSNIAPVSWAVSDHVDAGRDDVNYSNFATNPGEADETIEVILDGSMPPGYFTRLGLHPDADLTDSEVAELVAGLRDTPGMSEGDE